MTKFSLFNFETDGIGQPRQELQEQQTGAPSNPYTLDSPAVTASMTIYNHIINRLASNSNVCKTLAAGLVGLIVGLKTEISFWHSILISVCILAISYQDCMYVALKKKLEGVAEDLRTAVENNNYEDIKPFTIPKSKYSFKEIIKHWKSRSIKIFYVPILIALFGVWILKGGKELICNLLCN